MPMVMSIQNVVRSCAMMLAGTHSPCQSGLIDNAKSRMLEWRRLSQFVRVAPVTHVLLVSLTIYGGFNGYDGTCGAD